LGFIIIRPEHIPLPHTIRTIRDHIEIQQSYE
jgi:hypothetical protein